MSVRPSVHKEALKASLENYLVRKGLRMTDQRRAVCGALVDIFPAHFEVPDVLRKMRGKATGCGRATVYRTLELLVGAGLVRKLELGRDSAVFELAAESFHHEHMVCAACGRIIEFESPEIEKLQDEVCREYGFTPISHMLKITGLCRSCVKAAKLSKA